MKTLLYDTLVSFYHLLDPLEEHADEAEELKEELDDVKLELQKAHKDNSGRSGIRRLSRNIQN